MALPKDKGAGNARAAGCARSRAWCVVNTRVSHHGHTGTPGISRANGFTAYSRLSPAIGLFVTVIPEKRLASQEFDASVEASGPHGFAVRAGAFRQEHHRVHRIPLPTFVTIAKRPSWWRETGGNLPVILGTDQPLMPATKWHDGQITNLVLVIGPLKSRRKNCYSEVKGLAVAGAQAQVACLG